MLLLGRGRRPGAGRDTALQHHGEALNPYGNDLGEGRGRALAETLRLNTTVTSLLARMTWERAEGGRWQKHCASTPRSRRSTLLASNGLGEGGGRALTETLCLIATLTSLDLRLNGLAEGGVRALAHTHRHTQTHKDTHTHTRTHTHTHTRTQTHTHTHARTCTRTHRHTDTQTHRHTDTQTHIHTDTQTRTHKTTSSESVAQSQCPNYTYYIGSILII
jgi:hypothetical protein